MGIYLINIKTLQSTLVVKMRGYSIFAPYWSPDAKHIAFGVSAEFGSNVTVPGDNDVYVVNRDGSDLRLLTGKGSDLFIGWSPDSQNIVYWDGVPGSASGTFYAVNVEDGTKTALTGLQKACPYRCPTIAIRPKPDHK